LAAIVSADAVIDPNQVDHATYRINHTQGIS
jgi:hypothetical protein